jgi:lysophospholipase L1-like esterase
VAIPIALLLFVALDLFVWRLERVPRLILRNEGRSQMALSYFFRQIELTRDRPVIAFFGASETQGVVNTTPDTAYPPVVERLLAERGIAARCFNLANIGNGLADNLALGTEAIRRGADVLVFNIHFRIFSHDGSLQFTSTYRENLYYLRDRPDFRVLRAQYFMTSPREYLDIRLDQFVRRYWAFYRERELLSHLLVPSREPAPLPARLSAWLVAHGSLGRKLQAVAAAGGLVEPAERNRDDLWRAQPEKFHETARRSYQNIPIAPDDTHFRAYQLLCALNRDGRARVVVMLTPLNKAAAAEYGYWDQAAVAQFVQTTREIAAPFGPLFLDFTEAVEPRHFSDSDHLNMNGHAALAAALVGRLSPVIPGQQP